GPRRMAHGIATGVIVLLLLMLALVSRLSVGRRIIVAMFSMLLIVFVAAQLWFGSLLMFDSNIGGLGRFNGAGGEAPATMPSTSPAAPSTVPGTIPRTAATTRASAEEKTSRGDAVTRWSGGGGKATFFPLPRRD